MTRKLFCFLLLLTAVSCFPAGMKAQDWAGRAKYAEANAALPAADSARPRVVLMGDSITEEWVRLRPSFFSDNGFIGRGISGQVSAQMLVRFRQDVLDLQPDVVVINGGTNDVAENQGPYDEDFTFGCIVSMVELAQAGGIAVVMTSVLPAARFSWRPALTDAADKIAALNVRLRAYAEAHRIPFVDYYTPMVVPDESRALDPALSKDGVHPLPAGYEVMEPLVKTAVAEALAAAAASAGACGC